MRWGDRGWSRSRTAFVALLTLPFIYPFIFLVGTAIKPLSEFDLNEAGLPHQVTFANIRGAWTEAALGSAMLHSVIAVTIGSFVTVAASALGAYWFVNHEHRRAKTLRYAFVIALAVPPPVFIMPLFIFLARLGWTDNLVVLALVYGGWNTSFGIYLVYSFMKEIPSSLVEAAQVDGAGMWRTFRDIMLPICRPVLATLAVLSFIWAWADLLIALVLVQDPSLRLLTPATTLLADQYSTDIPREAAGVLIAVLPMLAVFLLGQKWLVRGVVAGVGR